MKRRNPPQSPLYKGGLRPVVRESLREALRATGAIRSMRIIQFGLAGGLVVVLIILLTFYQISRPEAVQDTNKYRTLIALLSIIHVTMAVSFYSLWQLLLPRVYTKRRLQQSAEQAGRLQTEPLKKIDRNSLALVTLIRSSSLIRLALIDALALFGALVCFTAIASAVIYTRPFYWLNAASLLFGIVYMFKTLPGEQKILDLFTSQIRPRLGL